MNETPEDSIIVALTAERDALLERLSELEADFVNVRATYAAECKAHKEERKQHELLQRYVAIVAPGPRKIAGDYWKRMHGAAKVVIMDCEYAVTAKIQGMVMR